MACLQMGRTFLLQVRGDSQRRLEESRAGRERSRLAMARTRVWKNHVGSKQLRGGMPVNWAAWEFRAEEERAPC